MTKTESCKTCEYFDSKDWDSETKNWCRYNDLPAINEGLCGHHKPMVRPCPVCGGLAEVYIGEKDLWKVGCGGCRIFATNEKKKEAIRLWNEVNSREVKADSVLRPCPFCGSENVALTQDEYGSWAVECYGYMCHAYVTNAKWRCERKEDAIALWNRRVRE